MAHRAPTTTRPSPGPQTAFRAWFTTTPVRGQPGDTMPMPAPPLTIPVASWPPMPATQPCPAIPGVPPCAARGWPGTPWVLITLALFAVSVALIVLWHTPVLAASCR